MTARIFNLACQLRLHRVGGWALDRWAVTLAWGASVFILTRWAWRGQPALPAWHWLVLALLLLGGAAVMVLAGWAARRSYVVFLPEPGLVRPAPLPLLPEDKIPLRATGRFDVQGRERFFADLPAYWRTYASREHAVLAIQHPSRFLLLGHSRAEDAGMWYAFISPTAITEVTPGELRSGRRISPGLRVIYRRQPPAPEGKRLPKAVVATVYLAFEDKTSRARAWADLMADADVTSAGRG
jgi:hypothetical protein